ncbi:MAG: hypothetical protein ACMUHU_06495 [Thermoplasmatota archaeon]
MSDEDETFGFQKELEKAKTLTLTETRNFDVPEVTDWIEPTLNAKTYNLDEVTNTIKMEGIRSQGTAQACKGCREEGTGKG